MSATRLAPAVCALVALSVLVPFVLKENAWFEWTNALWLVERQADSMRELGHPTYFLHTTETGLFYPQFAFYGGSLFAATGALAIVLGSAWGAFVAVIVVALACAYGGVLWIGRQLGLNWTSASLAALVVPTSPYFVTNLYGRGAWTEIVATSALPLALAGGLAVMRSRRPWAGVAALAAAVALVAGSHNLTLLWGTFVCSLIALVAGWALGREGLGRLSLGRVALSLGALALGGCLVAWSMIPAAAYGPDTRAYGDGRSLMGLLAGFDRLDVVLRPYPFVPSALEAANPDVKFQMPVYVLAWVSVAILVALVAGRGRRADRRAAVGLCAVLGLLVVLLVNTPLWYHFPSLLTAIQFPLRLHAYVVVVMALLVVVALRLVRDSTRRTVWIVGLVGALAVQTVIAEVSAWGGRGDLSHDQIDSERLPQAFDQYQRRMYQDISGTPIDGLTTSLVFDVAGVSSDTASAEFPPGTRTPVETNIVASPFVRVAMPWRTVGRSADGLQVIEGGTAGGVIAEPASPWPITLARLLSLSAGVVIASSGVLLALASWRRRSLRR